MDKFSRLQGPQPFLRRRQIFIIGLWGEKDDDKLLADDGFLAAVGADGKLRNCSAQQARFARAWHTQDRAVGSVDLPMLFRLQWDVWHSCWLWSAAWIDENRPRLDGGQSHFDVWPRWLAETSDGAEAAFSSRESPGIGDGEPELLWAAGGDGGDHGWLFCFQAATDVQEFELDAAWMSACMESRAPQRGSRSEGRRPQVAGQIASCAADSCLPPACRSCRDPKNNGEETQVLQDVSPPESRRPQVGLLQGAAQGPCSTGHCLPLSLLSRLSFSGGFQLPAFASCLQGPLAAAHVHALGQDAGTQVLQHGPPLEARRPQVAGHIASCAADSRLPLACRSCHDPKNNGEETQVLQDVSLPESRRAQVGMLQDAVQVPCSTGHCLPLSLLSRLSLTGCFQLPDFASCLQGPLATAHVPASGQDAGAQVLHHASPLVSWRSQVEGHDASCAADSGLPLASRSRHCPKNYGEETHVLQEVFPPKSWRPQVTTQFASCAADSCLPIASGGAATLKITGRRPKYSKMSHLPKVGGCKETCSKVPSR